MLVKTNPPLMKAGYGPVSLTCIASKLFDHIVTSNLIGHLGNRGILYEKQYGFRKGRSCESQLLEPSHDLLNGLHDGKQTYIIVMDFAKPLTRYVMRSSLPPSTATVLTPPPSTGSKAS